MPPFRSGWRRRYPWHGWEQRRTHAAERPQNGLPPYFLVCITGFVPSHRRVRDEHSEGPAMLPSGCTGLMIRVRTADTALHTLRLTSPHPVDGALGAAGNAQ
ncbi:MAG: hypothetical protein ACHBMF_03110 [Chromatiales bacterium]